MGQRHLGRTHVWIFFVSLLVPCCTAFRGAPAQEVKQIKPDKSFVVGLKGLSAGGLAFDGKSLWVSAQSVRVPDRLLRYNLEGKLLSSVPIPDAANSAGGLAYDGKAIYLLDYATRFAEGKILRLDKQGKTLDAVPLPKEQKNTFGLTYANMSLIYGHSPAVRPAGTLYRVDGGVRVQRVAEVNFYVRGLAWDGKSTWVSTMDKIHRVDKDFKVIDTYAPSVKVADLAWANGALWAVEHNNNMVHRFSIKPKMP